MSDTGYETKKGLLLIALPVDNAEVSRMLDVYTFRSLGKVCCKAWPIEGVSGGTEAELTLNELLIQSSCCTVTTRALA